MSTIVTLPGLGRCSDPGMARPPYPRRRFTGHAAAKAAILVLPFIVASAFPAVRSPAAAAIRALFSAMTFVASSHWLTASGVTALALSLFAADELLFPAPYTAAAPRADSSAM